VYSPFLAQFRRTALAVGIVVSSSLQSVHAQPAVLEEILVTAQKREEPLSEVPMSLNVVGAERLLAGNINKIADLVEFVPSLAMTETAVSTQLYVRGIGSGNNQAFEQSVGQYVDGLYYSRQQLIRAPFLDLARVEVLRGPQSTLFGKNSIAGALNLTTARPTDERELSVNTLYEFESNQRELNAVASGPLTETLRARIALRGYDEDGYIENTLKNRDEPQREENAARVTVVWEPTGALSATVKLEHGTYDTLGRQIEVVRDEPNLLPPGSSPLAGLNLDGLLRILGQRGIDGRTDFRRQADADEFSESTYDNFTLSVEYTLGDYTLSAIGGRIAYDFNELCDCDYTGARVLYARLGEDYEQWSQELRLASAADRDLRWMTGLYWQQADFRSYESISIPTDSVIGLLAATSPDPRQQAFAAILGTEPLRRNAQKTDTWAWFAQVDWQFTDSLQLSIGGRYTGEEKRATRHLDVFTLGTMQPAADPRAALLFYQVLGVHSRQLAGLQVAPGVVLPGHDLRGERREHQFTPSFTLTWDLSDDISLYARASRGYKGGGFDARANNPWSFEFQEERARDLELGSKGRYFDGALELNAALFLTHYRDLQVSQFDGALGFNVGNARETRVGGLELDGRWALTDELTFGYSYAYLHFEYTDFRNGNCYNRQPPTGPVIDGVARCDYTGKRGQYAPRHSASLSLDHRHRFGSDWTLASSLMLNYRSELNLHENLDPNMKAPGVTRTNVRIAVETASWYAAFVGKNLTDEVVLSYAANVPLASSLFGTNTYYGLVERGRQLALEAGLRF